MFETLPQDWHEFQDWDWPQIQPYFDDLQNRPLTQENVDRWLADWTRLIALVQETEERRHIAYTINTTDPMLEQRYLSYMETVIEPYRAAAQTLKQKFLNSGLQPPPGFEIAARDMQAQAEIFHPDNLKLLTEEDRLISEYERITGTQTVEWEGEERTLSQLRPLLQDADRTLRERVWRLSAERQLADREAINSLWVKFMNLRRQLAANAGFDDYRAYRWRDLLRFDYTPDDCLRFHDLIEEIVVPAAQRVYERRRQRLGYDTLRPWDLDVDTDGKPPLRPFTDAETLNSTAARVFHRVDPVLGAYFDTMRQESLLDLENRKGKAPGGYCTHLPASRRPFIFMNAVGLHDDVQTLLHEGGHAFHAFETLALPYAQQWDVPTEFAEVASMSMELLGQPYLAREDGGFYSREDANRATVEHLEGSLQFWPYMAVVDAFQHWVYTHHEAATDPANCDAQWLALWNRFMKGVDWTGLETEAMTGWHRKLHIHEIPFYYVEYGLAQQGAAQVWRNSLSDQAGAVAAYRRALALGNTRTLPELFQVAGAQFMPDAGTFRACVDLMEATIAQLDPVA